MKNIILAIDRVEPGLVSAAHKIAKDLQIEIRGVALVDKEFKKTGDYLADNTGFFEEIVCDFNNSSVLQQMIKPFQDNILAVHCRIETGIQDLIKAVPFLPYTATPTESSLRWATEKTLMRERLRGYDVNLVPKFKPIQESQLHDVKEIVTDMDFPLIIKPSGLNSSMLVIKCETLEELTENLAKTYAVIHDVYDRERGSGDPQLLIEEFMIGDMYSTDAYVTPDGEVYCLPPVRVITSHEVGLPGFYGYQFELPAELSAEELRDCEDAAIKSVKALNLRACTAHIELYNCNGKWKIIELGPRIGGHRADLYRESYGTDHYYNDLASRIPGLKPIMPNGLINYSICMDLYPEKEGIITKFTGFENVQKLETCVFIHEHAEIGQEFYSAENGSPFAAEALFSGPDKSKVIADAGRARELIKIHTKPF
jgi:hypothetical protein